MGLVGTQQETSKTGLGVTWVPALPLRGLVSADQPLEGEVRATGHSAENWKRQSSKSDLWAPGLTSPPPKPLDTTLRAQSLEVGPTHITHGDSAKSPEGEC